MCIRDRNIVGGVRPIKNAANMMAKSLIIGSLSKVINASNTPKKKATKTPAATKARLISFIGLCSRPRRMPQ